jgi:hypothetical protein
MRARGRLTTGPGDGPRERSPRGARRACAPQFAVALALAASLAPFSAAAQTRFRGAPLPECRSFFLTEVSGGVIYDQNFVATADLGYMRNLDPGSAVGGSIFLSAEGVVEDSWVAFGLRPRYRRWLSRQTSLDAALAVGGVAGTSGSTDGGLLVHTELTFGAWDLVGITVGVAYSSAAYDSNLHPLAAIRFGSWIGSGLMAAGLASGVVAGL